MNVLYVVGGEGNRYGSEIIAIELIEAGKANGIDYNVIVANKGAVWEACKRLGVPCISVPFFFFVYKESSNRIIRFFKKTIWRLRAEFFSKRATKIIAKKINLDAIDLIHTNLSRDLLGGMLAEKYKKPHIWHIQELYKAHYQLSFLRRNQVQWMNNHVNRYIAISESVANDWIKAGLSRDKMSVVYNGVDSDKILPRETSEENAVLKLVMVGHLVPAKGQEIVIKALAQLPATIKEKTTLDCIGEGGKAYKQYLQEMANKHEVSFAMRGYCTNVGELLRDYQVGINCSKGEGFGLSTVEYMCAGLCPVVANTGANTEIVNEHNGYIFDYNEADSLTAVIEHLFYNRKELEQRSKNAMNEAKQKYSIDRMRSEILEVYRECCIQTQI